ncbi:competence protein CoiA [Lactobacillus hamsteri]|nr:competence protein CoiA family protein [Lactobacillus hamsteri]
MYAAMLKKKLVLAVDEERHVLNKEKKLNFEKYRCPHCRKPVILILSQKKSAFFKHLSEIDNTMGEKEEHYTSKNLLKSAFTAAGFNAQMEVPLADGQLRADVLVSPKLSLEVQCAPLSKEEFLHRHNLYKQINVLDLWIVGQRHYLKTKLKKTQLIFFRENKLWGIYYLEIDLKRNYLRLKYNVIQEPITNKLRYQIVNFKLDEIGMRKFWYFRPKRKKYQLNSDSQRQYLMRQIKQKTHLGLAVAEKLYRNHLSVEQLPDELFEKWRKPGEKSSLFKYLEKLDQA